MIGERVNKSSITPTKNTIKRPRVDIDGRLYTPQEISALILKEQSSEEIMENQLLLIKKKKYYAKMVNAQNKNGQ